MGMADGGGGCEGVTTDGEGGVLIRTDRTWYEGYIEKITELHHPLLPVAVPPFYRPWSLTVRCKASTR
jgi:hypothetical protein